MYERRGTLHNLGWMLTIAFLALGAAAIHPDPIAAFARNDRHIGDKSCDIRMKAVEVNLAILVRAVAKSDPSHVKDVEARFDALAKKNDDGFETSFSWVSATKERVGRLTVVCVNYGPVGRVQAFDGTDAPYAEPAALLYMVRRNPSVLALEGRYLVVASSDVRDAGMDENTRLDFLLIDAGRNRAIEIRNPFEAVHTLDWGGPELRGDRIVFDSIDAPKSFYVSRATTILRRRRVFDMRGRLLSDRAGDAPIRFFDQWLYRAQHARHPSPLQMTARKCIPAPDFADLFSWTSLAKGRVAVTLGALRLTLRKADGRYIVVSAVQVP